MTEIITWTISDPEVLKAKGVEVLYRCKDCEKAFELYGTTKLSCIHFGHWDYYDDVWQDYLVEPDNYCFWVVPKN